MSPDQPTLEHTPEFPRAFGKYDLLGLLGSGGMGSVYRARPRAGGSDVALKMPLPTALASDVQRERFYREYQALHRCRHPGLAPVFEFDRHEGACYFTMQLVPGAALDKCRPTDQFAAARLVRAVAEIVAHVHAAGILHRDLKPQNVVVRPDGTPVVVDFGIARFTHLPPGESLTGGSIGTPQYMPPEQWNPDGPHPIGPASDVYALGAVLYWALTGFPPFVGGIEDLMKRVPTEPPVPPERLNPSVDPRLSALALRALAKAPADRFESMAALGAALDAILNPPALPGTARAVRFEFVGPGTVAPADAPGRLYLDVGNDVRPGVLDHHHGGGAAESATGLVALRPEFARAALAGAPDGTVTVVLHEHPDLDCAAASYLACELLRTGALPPGADRLAAYLARVDSGAPMFTLKKPYTLYAAYMLLARRLADAVPDRAARWDALVRGGHRLIEFALATTGPSDDIGTANAFGAPVMTKADRLELLEDVQRYERKLARPETRARRAALTLPTPFGTAVRAGALFAREVQNEGDAERCSFFKDWARGDAERCPASGGFVALCVWQSVPVPRCIVSVRPDSDARLYGLAAALDAAETTARAGTPLERTGPPRPGYDTSDPWYDGRAHDHTIIDAPRSGTALTADAVERVVLEWAAATAEPL